MITLHNDNCKNILESMASNSVDVTLTDIPYEEVNRKSSGLRKFNVANADVMSDIDITTLTNEIIRVTKGSIYMWCGIGQISTIDSIMRDNGLSTRLCVWQKSNPSPVNGQYMWLSGMEYCVFGRKPKATFNEKCKTPLWIHPCGKNKIHPTMKPVEMFKTLISASSNKNDTIFDPFMGSGTTGVACKLLGRKFVGVELDEGYFTAASKRIDETISLKVLEDECGGFVLLSTT